MALFHIVLVHPEIPQNTGAIGRLCVSTDTKLHLIEPLGFSLEDKYLKRAGMDYWNYLDKQIYPDWDAFLQANPDAEEKLFFLSTKGTKSFWDISYPEGSYFAFGNEGHGLPKPFYERYAEKLITIPMRGTFHRSLNLANSTAIMLFEALRQNEQKA